MKNALISLLMLSPIMGSLAVIARIQNGAFPGAVFGPGATNVAPSPTDLEMTCLWIDQEYIPVHRAIVERNDIRRRDAAKRSRKDLEQIKDMRFSWKFRVARVTTKRIYLDGTFLVRNGTWSQNSLRMERFVDSRFDYVLGSFLFRKALGQSDKEFKEKIKQEIRDGIGDRRCLRIEFTGTSRASSMVDSNGNRLFGVPVGGRTRDVLGKLRKGQFVTVRGRVSYFEGDSFISNETQPQEGRVIPAYRVVMTDLELVLD